MKFAHKRKTSGVQARRSAGVPSCAWAEETATSSALATTMRLPVAMTSYLSVMLRLQLLVSVDRLVSGIVALTATVEPDDRSLDDPALGQRESDLLRP